jgi:lipopolysaccharide transport system ATP-binding protein
MNVIKVENLSKLYRLGQVGTGSIFHDVNRWWHGVRGKEDPYMRVGEENDRTQKGKSDYVWALKDINFDVQQGEVLGIIGRNGAGKSTLLKILSRTTSPTTGSIKVKGRIASLLEVGTGFHPELSGRDNIFMNGTILGMTRAEIKSKFDEIVEFAGVERYLDTPVKRYSSGMYVRLAFAVAAHLESEILIVDEVLAVGDAEFQKKCLGKMKDVSEKQGRTVLFVSHNMQAIGTLSNSALLLNKGACVFYQNCNLAVESYISNKTLSSISFENSITKPLCFNRISILNCDGALRNSFNHNEQIKIEFGINFNLINVRNEYTLFVEFLDRNNNTVFSSESSVINSKTLLLFIPANTFTRGNYSIRAFIHIAKKVQIDLVDDILGFSIVDIGSEFNKHGDYNYGSVFVKTDWQYLDDLIF